MSGMGRGYLKLLRAAEVNQAPVPDKALVVGHRFDGVRLCHKDDMSHDFGCFSVKEETR